MNKTIKTIFALLVLVFLVSCATQQVPAAQRVQTTKTEVAPKDNVAVQTVELKGFAFAPETLTVKAGTVVEWVNLDSAQHTVTSTSGPESFDSKKLEQNGRYSFTFTKPGTYEYYCELHPGMKGKVVVE